MKPLRTALALSLITLTGCGAILHGTRQDLMVQSSPAGAKVSSSPETGTFTTPTNLSLERKNNYVLTFSSPGYQNATFNVTNSIGIGTVIADVLLTGIVGVVIDAATGAWYGLNPESGATVTLTRVGADAGSKDPADVIHLTIGKPTKGTGMDIKTDAPGVSVTVTRK